MQKDTKWTEHQAVMRTAALLAALLYGNSVKADVQSAAFLQPDPVTKKQPFQAVKVTRGKVVVGADGPIQPCDQLEFDSTQSDVKQVLVTTYRSGRSILLNTLNPMAVIACEESGLSGAAAKVWQSISSRVDPKPPPILAITRGKLTPSPFALPIFASERSQIISGKRALVVPWVGGVLPYKVVLKRATTGEVLAEVKAQSGHSVRLPEIDLQPGQYSLTVFNTPVDGSQPGLEEQHLFAVNASELPEVPDQLKTAKLDPVEATLLYVFYLEGHGDGRWAFEAFQRAASIDKPTTAVKDWLQNYTYAE